MPAVPSERGLRRIRSARMAGGPVLDMRHDRRDALLHRLPLGRLMVRCVFLYLQPQLSQRERTGSLNRTGRHKPARR